MSSPLNIQSSVRSVQTQGLVWRGLVLTALCLAVGTLQAQDNVSGMGIMPAAQGSAPLAVQAPGSSQSPFLSMRPSLGAAASGAANPLGAYSDMGQGTGALANPVAQADRPALGTNQFQRFVQSATGRDLPLYGYNLFNGQKFGALANVPVPAHYVIGPGDDIDLKLWGSVDMAQRLTVDRNGQINIPKVGTVTVAGTRADQLEKTLKSNIGRVFNNFELNATLGRLRSIQVYVVGQARQPGAYTVPGMSSLLSTLFESGGPSATGSMRHIQLVRAGNPASAVAAVAALQAQVTVQEVKLGAMRGYLAETAPDFKQALNELATLRAQLAKQSKDSATPPPAGQGGAQGDYVTRYREFKYQETLFELFAKQFEMAKVDESREGANIQVLDKAQAPELKSKPKKALIAILATLATGFALLLFVFVRQALRNASQDSESAQKLQVLQASWRKAIGR